MARLPKTEHEIRDPVHVFIKVSSDERRILDSRAVQRLRYIHQLAMTNLVYPGANHSRLEHSLGTMHLASRVFDVVTDPHNITDDIRRTIPEITEGNQLGYWRSALRMAGLCHDLGHLPFSHAAEQLLPAGRKHEHLSRTLIMSEEMQDLWRNMIPPLLPEHIVKLALGKEKARELEFTPWEEILSEIITGDAFGVDRMDYLLRDSLHAGAPYGRFDHDRLTSTLRILTSPARDPKEMDEARPPALGVEHGGLHSAEALLLARYFMFSQVYFHPIRRVYDLHLVQFLSEWLKDGKYSIDPEDHLAMTDNEVFAAMASAARDPNAKGHEHARRILSRDHYRVLYERLPEEAARNPEVLTSVAEAAAEEFGADTVLGDKPEDLGKPPDFPVLVRGGKVVSSHNLSDVLNHMPVISMGYVFVRPDLREKASAWLEAQREELTKAAQEDSAEDDLNQEARGTDPHRQPDGTGSEEGEDR